MMIAIQGNTTIKAPAIKTRTKLIKKRFVREYVKNGGNASKAALVANRSLAPSSARRTGSRLLKRDDIQLMIQDALDETQISYKYVLENRKEIVDMGMRQIREGKGENEQWIQAKDVHQHLQGIEGIMERLGGSSSQPSGNSLHLHLDAVSHQELLEKRREIMGFFSGITDDVQPLVSVDPPTVPPTQSGPTVTEPETSK